MYSKKTNFYQIPYMGYGDMLTEEDEKSQLTIIDNLLYAATFGVSKCILEEGKYSLVEDEENAGFYKLRLDPINGYSAVGIINYRLYLSKEIRYSNSFMKGEHYHIYIQYDNLIEIDPNQFNIVYSYKELDDLDTLLKICEVDYTGEEPVLILDIEKDLSKNVLAHTKDSTNPHGKELTQDILNILSELKINENKIFSSIYDSVISNGTDGIEWMKEGYKPIFIQVYPEDFCGEISCKIEDNKIIIKNNGNQGIKLNIKVDVEKI